jgi:hypothetical protein
MMFGGRGRKKLSGAPKKKRKTPAYAPFRSALEKRISTKISPDFMYEPKSISVEYMTEHKYSPDFVLPSIPEVLIEVKGYFRESSEASKYVSIKRSNPNLEIIFIFSNSFKKAHPNCRPRKDGTLLTLSEWCTKHGFLFYEEHHLPHEIVKGAVTWKWVCTERRKFGLPQRAATGDGE